MIDKTNPWHKVSIGEDSPDVVTAIIEIPQGNRAKYELDKETGLLKLDRVIYSAMYYPANYGFIPQTYCDDKDPLDILVFSQTDVVPMCILDARVIGVMHMIDGGEKDDKIIAVAEHDMSVNHYTDLSQLPQHFLKEMRNFFEDYKKLEGKSVSVEEFQDSNVAKEVVNQSIIDYKEYVKKHGW